MLVIDDRKLSDLLRAYLRQFGMDVLMAANPDEGLALLRASAPSLVILDLRLPQRDGFTVCREIRRESSVLIIMLTACGELADRVAGLELGADDYLPKPFEPRELVARIQTVLRRSGTVASASPGEHVQAGDLTVDLQSREVWLDSVPVDLTTTEFEILALFLRRPGTVLSRDQIMDRLRGMEWEAYDRSIDVAVSRLRPSFATIQAAALLQNRLGHGIPIPAHPPAHEAGVLRCLSSPIGSRDSSSDPSF